MKPIFTQISILAVTGLLLVHCAKDNSFNVPPASSQAKFTYTWEVKSIGDSSYFQVTIQNQSIEAAAYLWDFGDGRTSTEREPVITYAYEGDYTLTLTVTPFNNVYYNKLIDSKNFRLLFKFTHFVEDFNLETSLSRFTLIDNDGDTFNWYWNFFEDDANGYMLSRSWSSQNGPLTPDNWMVSPEIDLSQVVPGKEIFLTYTVCPSATTPIYRTENYSIMISTAGANVADFTPVFTETLLSSMTNWVYLPREIDLGAYAGMKIRFAFRHHDSTDKDRISIDNIELYSKY
jgi:hypothetical protein